MRSRAAVLGLLASAAVAFRPPATFLSRTLAPMTSVETAHPTTPATSPKPNFNRNERRTALAACRRNTKKEKRLRNAENMRKFRRAPTAAARAGPGRKKTVSRKKMTLKEQSNKEKAREAAFMSKLFVATGGVEEKTLDLGVL